MLTAPPTQAGPQPPALPPPAPEQRTEPKQIALTPSKPRIGEMPTARAVKAILRPVIKAIYYVITWIRTHKLATLITIILLLLSISVTTRLMTGYWPFNSPSTDAVQQSLQNNPQLSPDIQLWLTALENGDLTSMQTLQKTIPASGVQPDDGAFLGEFSAKYAGVTWNGAKVDGVSTAADGQVDAFVEVDISIPATSTTQATNAIVLWHFVTNQGRITAIDFISARAG